MRGYKFGCVCSYVAGLILVWSYKFGCVWSVSFRPTQTRLCKFGRQPVDPVVADPVRQDNDKIWIFGSFVPYLCVLGSGVSIYIYIYAQESVFWPPFPEFVVSNLTTFFGSNFNNLIRNPDTTCKRQKKTTRNSFFVVSILSTLSSVICPPKCQYIAPQMWTNYWQSRGQITDHEVWVLNTKSIPNKISQNTKIGIWMDHYKNLQKEQNYRPFTRPPL